MSEINKLDSTPCSSDPDQYKVKVTIENDTVAPVGSFPWVVIQVYLGNIVRRNGWDSRDEYIKLIPSVTGYDGKIIPPQIWTVDKDDEQPWTPTQDDMMSCDWVLYTSS
ncbi:Thoeris anti-defense Tad2 family protein [Xenorhabdus bovienii]|uniref:Thoeris anti-defense 2-like domain-containing protein n=1 Tax=Xenorhabdus bovienii str. kraussei Becker Underwood TaxID=1398204 RepID=A0A077PNQ3_XENBV|nr:MW1434 family type I TA system toxin [Xenorhabdus bovienii]CDH26040.1 conserved hypothetical protein [Xenorhabdus bovienii str. kraussei Becker Underwood]